MAKRNEDSVIGTIGLEDLDCKFQQKQQTVLSPKHQDWLWNQTASDSMGGSRVLSQASLSHLHLTLRLTMGAATQALPSYRPHGVVTDNFTVYSMASQLPCPPAISHITIRSVKLSLSSCEVQRFHAL
jgi:hypothetical protein